MPVECHPNLASLLLMGSLKQCPPGMKEAIKVRKWNRGKKTWEWRKAKNRQSNDYRLGKNRGRENDGQKNRWIHGWEVWKKKEREREESKVEGWEWLSSNETNLPKDIHLEKSWWFSFCIAAVLTVFASCLHAPFNGIQWLPLGFHQSFNTSLIKEDEQAPVATWHAFPASVSFVVLCLLWLGVQARVVFLIKSC